MLEHDVEKSVYWSIESIKNLQKEKAFKAKLPGFPIDESIAISKKRGNKGFEIKFFLNQLYGNEYLKEIEKFGVFENIILDKSGNLYSVKKESITNASITISTPQVVSVNVKNFQTASDESFENKALRLLIPIKKDCSFDAFESKRLLISGTITMCGLIEVVISAKLYHVFKYKNDDTNEKYLIIDSVGENSLDEFKSNTNAILVAFAFVTGNLYQNDYYYQAIREDNVTLADDTAFFKTEPSIISNANLFSPYEFEDYLRPCSKNKVLKREPATIFSVAKYEIRWLRSTNRSLTPNGKLQRNTFR